MLQQLQRRRNWRIRKPSSCFSNTANGAGSYAFMHV
jgi:hypothetical protein